MDGTMWTINLILLALAYGGALERCGCVERLFGGLKHKIHSVGSLILATLLTSIFCDATMCDQFLGIGVPAPIDVYKRQAQGLSSIRGRFFHFRDSIAFSARNCHSSVSYTHLPACR